MHSMNPIMKLVEGYAATILSSAPLAVQRRTPAILWMGDPGSRELALSFDDGPHPRDTPALLEVLARYEVQATFSWLGERVEAWPNLAAEVVGAGHQLMIHGYRHRSFLLEHPSELRVMLDRTRALLARHGGLDPERIRSVRPPFGHLSGGLVRKLLAWGYRPVLGSLVPVHWLIPQAVAVRQVVQQARGGDLIVLHEALGGPPVAGLTDAILSRLAPRGFSFVSVETLWQAHDRVFPGATGAR